MQFNHSIYLDFPTIISELRIMASRRGILTSERMPELSLCSGEMLLHGVTKLDEKRDSILNEDHITFYCLILAEYTECTLNRMLDELEVFLKGGHDHYNSVSEDLCSFIAAHMDPGPYLMSPKELETFLIVILYHYRTPND